MTTSVRAYLSPTLVLLAFDWPEGESRADFLGFAIKRTPGFWVPDGKTRADSSWLPNRLTFAGPVPYGKPDAGSNMAPIQKFMWWDARIDPQDREKDFVYEVFPVTGSVDNLQLLENEKSVCSVVLPAHVEDKIGTWFNRAVVSSQAFSNKLKAMGLNPNTKPPADKDLELRTWLANDIEQVVPYVLEGATSIAGAVYHLTDKLWVIPALRKFASVNSHRAAFVYDAHLIRKKNKPSEKSPTQLVVDTLGSVIDFYPRDKTSIMHNKVLVTGDNGKPARIMMGSANMTTNGFTQQANLLHTFDSPELANLYNAQMEAISSNPTLANTAKLTKGWSQAININQGTRVRVSFSPAAKGIRTQIDTIIEAIDQAQHSVLFCMFMPTDNLLLDACFTAADRGLAMFGLVNNIDSKAREKAKQAEADGKKLSTSQLASLELYHRSKEKKDVVEGAYFSKSRVPAGFVPEILLYPGEEYPPYAPVVIHHKFIVIDAEGDNPVVYSGSPNMSNNSQYHNDENLLEIKSAKVAAIYLAEGLRLYEHYRARAIHIDTTLHPQRKEDLKLKTARDEWALKYFKKDSPEYKARLSFAAIN